MSSTGSTRCILARRVLGVAAPSTSRARRRPTSEATRDATAARRARARRPPRPPPCRASRPFARNAATMPVSTSPVPAVASPGASVSTTIAPPPGQATIVSAPLSRHDAAEALSAARRTASSRCAVDPVRLDAEQARELARVRREHGRRRARSTGSRLEERVGVDDGRKVELARAAAARARLAAHRRGRGRARARARARELGDRSARASSRRRPPSKPASPARAPGALDDRQRRLGHGERDVAGVGAEAPPRGEARRAGQSRARRRRRAPSPAVYFVSARARGAGPRRGSPASTSGARSRRGSSPMSATTTSPAWKRPGATSRPTFRPWNVTVRSASTAAPATSPVEAFTPEGRSTATTGAPAALMRSISAAPPPRAARRGTPVPKSASTTTSGLLDRSSSRRRSSGPPREDASGDPAVAAVRASAADDGEAARVGVARASPPRRPPRPARSISSSTSGPGYLLLGRAHLVGGVERLEHQPPAATTRDGRLAPARASASSRGRSRPHPDALGEAERPARRASRPASAARRSRSPSR